ncbi:MAG TPA: hypothetical protein VEF55_13435 [Candidatus Binatia bacterium]|nr:hypothetical protein [Candidatus Binatia bacterium]
MPEPESWASSEVKEGINQLGRAAFLTAAWRQIVSERDHSWIDQALVADSHDTYGLGQSLRRILNAGVDKSDLTFVVRAMQHELLAGIAYLLDDQRNLPVTFALFEIDPETRCPVSEIAGVHESTLETDPEGIEGGSIRGRAAGE